MQYTEKNLSRNFTQLLSKVGTYEQVVESSRPAIERPGLESQRSRKRHFFHRKIFKFFKILFNIICDIHFETLLYIFKVYQTVIHSSTFGTS